MYRQTQALLILPLLSTFANATIHVSTLGADANAGTQEQPVASPQRALDLSLKNNDPDIVFADGTYHLNGILKLNAKYSGKKQSPRTLRAENEGKAIFSAGKTIEVDWKANENGVFIAKIPADFGSLELCDGLFIDGQQTRLARFPNYDRSARWLKGTSAEAFSPNRIKSWKNPKGGILHTMHPHHWGGNHWTITGKKSETECSLEGGWMNNRGGGVHPKDRYVENIFEELDDAAEWFLDKESRTLYYIPSGDFAAGKGKITLSQQESCVQLVGSNKAAVKHIRFEGISFRHTTRTFMKTKEPLLRSDWMIYRGGAVFLNNAENISLSDCEFTDLGGNAYFASGYNRNHSITGCHFHQIGAGALNFVGRTDAVHNPMYDPYGEPIAFNKINKRDKGPKTKHYPAHCVASDCLIHDIGLVEKQVAGLQISVAHKITGKHLSIYDVPRAGINISENAFGGHLIEHCDVFDTVQESADHGSFNSWGRDRFWHLDYRELDKQVARYPKLPLIDMLDRNVIRNSRWRCDHGWDIDLDDGSSGYLVENNLCLGGGIKLREGFYRTVRNNLVVADTFHPHVWFKDCQDEIYSNIWATPYEPIELTGKGKIWDKNIHLTDNGLAKAKGFGVDANALSASITFTDPNNLDYSFAPTAETNKLGFKAFDLTKFGVQKPSLKAQARTPEPAPLRVPGMLPTPVVKVLGATIKNVETLGEVSATGLPNKNGVLFREIAKESFFAKAGIKNNDVILAINGKEVNNYTEFLYTWAEQKSGKKVKISLWRKQRKNPHSIPSFPGVMLHARDAKISGSGAVYAANAGYIAGWSGHDVTLSWDAHLAPNASYSAIVDQSHPQSTSNSYNIEGFSNGITMPVAQTQSWDSFTFVNGNKPLKALDTKKHNVKIITGRMKHEQGAALMNFKALFLIKE